MALPFSTHVLNFCKELLIQCKQLFDTNLNLTEEEYRTINRNTNDLCRSLYEFIRGSTIKIAEKMALENEVGKLVVTLSEVVPNLTVLISHNDGVNSENAKATLAQVRGEMTEVVKNVIALARKTDITESNEIVEDRDPTLLAKEKCLSLVNQLSVSVNEQNRSSWKEAARQLAAEVQNLCHNLPKDRSTSMLNTVLHLVNVSKNCFVKTNDGEAAVLFEDNLKKVISMIQSVNAKENEQSNEQEPKFNITHSIDVPTARRASRRRLELQNANTEGDIDFNTDAVSSPPPSGGAKATQDFSPRHNRPREVLVQELKHEIMRQMGKSPSKNSGNESLKSQDSTNELENALEDPETNLDFCLREVSKTPTAYAAKRSQSTKKLFKSASMHEITAKDENGPNDVNPNLMAAIIKIVEDRFGNSWENLSVSRQEQFKHDLSKILSDPRVLMRKPQNSQLSDVLMIPQLEITKSDTMKPGIVVTESSPGSKKAKKENALTSTTKSGKRAKLFSIKADSTFKRKRKPGSGDGLALLSFQGDSTKASLSRTIMNSMITFLTEITKFVADSCTISIPKDNKKTSDKEIDAEVAKDEEKRKYLFSFTEKVIFNLKEILKLLPQKPENSAASITFIRVATALNTTFTKTENPELDYEMINQGFHLLLMKKNLLASIQFRSSICYFATSQFLSTLYCLDENDTSSLFHMVSLALGVDKAVRSIQEDIDTFSFLSQFEKRKWIQLKKDELKAKPTKQEKSESIWNNLIDPEKEDLNDRYRPGNLNNIIIRLTESVAEKDLLNTFVSSYHSYSTPIEILNKLIERYNVPKEEKMNPNEKKFLQIRVGNIMINWMKKDFQSLDLNVMSQIRNFCEKQLIKDQYKQIADKIKEELNVESRFCQILDSPFPDPSSHTIPVYSTDLPVYNFLMQQDEYQIAEQMTLIELEIYRRIEPSELQKQRWTKPKYQVLSQNVLFLIQRVNQVSFWVATFILMQSKVKDRAKALQKVIEIARHLENFNNYNSLMGILFGLTVTPVTRLQHTWTCLTSKSNATYQSLIELVNQTKSYKFLRDRMKEKGLKALPYLATYLQDLTGMDENVDFVTRGDVQLINIHKQHLINNTIKNLIQNQLSIVFDVERKEPLYTFLYELPGLNDKELYQLSLEREPKGILMKELL